MSKTFYMIASPGFIPHRDTNNRILYSVSSRTHVRDLNVFGQISPNVEMTPFFQLSHKHYAQNFG